MTTNGELKCKNETRQCNDVEELSRLAEVLAHVESPNLPRGENRSRPSVPETIARNAYVLRTEITEAV